MKSIKIISATIVAYLLASCSNDFEFREIFSKPVSEINVSIADADYTETPNTRSSHSVDPARGFVTTWTEGDTIGIYPIGADQVAFPISAGEGSSTAKFDGGAWALRANHQYGAYYPFSKKNYYIDETKIPVSYLDQKQIGNNNLDHLSGYDFMAAAAVSPDENGAVNMTMQHLGAFLRLTITAPEAKTYTKVRLSSDAAIFTTDATINLQNGSLNPTKKADVLMLLLDNVTTTEANQTITAYMMLAPIAASDISAHPISVTLFDDKGVSYVADLSFTSVVAGKSYAKSASVVLDGLDDNMVSTQLIMSDYMHIAVSGNLINCPLESSEKMVMVIGENSDYLFIPNDYNYMIGSRGSYRKNGESLVYNDCRYIDIDGTSFIFNIVNGGRYSYYIPNNTYYYRVAIVSDNKEIVKYGPIKSFTPEPYNAVPPTGGEHSIDLGLSVKWCCANLGASSYTDVGSYFAWGELEPKSEFTEENYLYYQNGEYSDIGDEYRNISNDPRYDPSSKYHTQGCRLPTPEEWQELVERCTWYRTTYNGQEILQVVGPNGNNIILPLENRPFDSSYNRTYYWSSAAYYGMINKIAKAFAASNDGIRVETFFYPGENWGNIGRYEGALIRPVSDY